MALIFVTLSFLVEQKRFHGHTIDIFKAVALEQRDASEVAKTFDTSVGNVYEAKRAVLVRLRAMLKELDKGSDLEQALATSIAVWANHSTHSPTKLWRNYYLSRKPQLVIQACQPPMSLTGCNDSASSMEVFRTNPRAQPCFIRIM